MKKSTALPALFGILVAIVVGAGAFIAFPYLRVFLSSGDGKPTPPPPVPPAETVSAPEPAKPEPAPKPPPPPPEKKEPPPAPKPEPAPKKPDADAAAKAAARAELEKKVAALYPAPQIKPLEEIVDHWNNVPQRAFPKGVTVSQPIEFQLLHEGQVIGGKTVPAGAHVVPVSLDGTTLVVAPDIGTSMRAQVPVDSTNFKDLIHARYMDFVQRQNARVTVARSAELDRLMKAEAYESALADFNDGKDARFDPVKASLKNGEAGTFELDFATEYRWLGKESVDGTVYEAAVVAFETESAFGVSRTEIKALLRDGKVERWVNAANGEPI